MTLAYKAGLEKICVLYIQYSDSTFKIQNLFMDILNIGFYDNFKKIFLELQK